MHPVFSAAAHRWSLLGIFQFLKRRTNKLGEFSGCGSKLGKPIFGWNRPEIPRITRNRLTLLEISRNRLTSVVKSLILIHIQRTKVFSSIAEMDKSRDVWCCRCLDKLTFYMSYNLHRKPWKRVGQPPLKKSMSSCSELFPFETKYRNTRSLSWWLLNFSWDYSWTERETNGFIDLKMAGHALNLTLAIDLDLDPTL